MPILIKDARFALDQYFKNHETPKFNSNQDVVMHIRCGDILGTGGNMGL